MYLRATSDNLIHVLLVTCDIQGLCRHALLCQESLIFLNISSILFLSCGNCIEIFVREPAAVNKIDTVVISLVVLFVKNVCKNLSVTCDCDDKGRG